MIKNFLFKKLYLLLGPINIIFGSYLFSSSMLDMQSRLDFIDHSIKVLENSNSETNKYIRDLIPENSNSKANKQIYELISQYGSEKNIEQLTEEKKRLQILNERFEKLKDILHKDAQAKDKSDDEKNWLLEQEFTKLNRILFQPNNNCKYLVNSPLSNQTYSQKLIFSDPTFITQDEFSKYCTENGNYIKKVNGRIIQLKVVLQISQNGGGSATCGYQALLNGFIIARLILSSYTQRALILHELMDKNLRMNLFGNENSLWRSAIINSRKGNILKKFFFNFLLMSLYDSECAKKRIVNKKIEDHEHRSLCRYIDHGECEYIYFNKLENIKDENERNFFMDNGTLNLLSSNIVKYLQQRNGNKIIMNSDLMSGIIMSTLKNNEKFSKVFHELDNVEKKNKIIKYLPGLKNSFEFSDEVVKDLTTGTSMLPYEWSRMLSGKQFSSPGEWLFGEEIFNIIEIEKTKGNIFKSIYVHQNRALFDHFPNELVNLIYSYFEENSYFVQYGDIELTENMKTAIKKNEILDPYDMRQDFKELVQFVIDPNSYGFRIMTIIVGGNHWIACVINKRRRLATERIGDDVQYILADSMDGDYTRSYYIKELLERLEGREIPEFAQGTSDGGWCVIS